MGGTAGAPYQGGFTPAAPGGQMMMGGSGTPYGMQPQMPTQQNYQQNSPLSPAQQGGARVAPQGGQLPPFQQVSNGGWSNWRNADMSQLGNAPPQLSQQALGRYCDLQQGLNRRMQAYKNNPNFNQQGMQFLQGKAQDLRQYRHWLNGAGQPVSSPTDPATGAANTPVTTDPATGQPLADAPAADGSGTGYATDVYGHYGTNPDGTPAATPYSADFDPRTAGMPTGNRMQQMRGLHDQLKARNQALQGGGVRGQDDTRYGGIQGRLQAMRPQQNQYRADAKSARDANMQTLLAAQTAGTTLTPEQLDWLTKMQAKNA
jgi:hypothetical protein